VKGLGDWHRNMYGIVVNREESTEDVKVDRHWFGSQLFKNSGHKTD
jgi:hypothetical protein